jgi:hypothetical protein
VFRYVSHIYIYNFLQISLRVLSLFLTLAVPHLGSRPSRWYKFGMSFHRLLPQSWHYLFSSKNDRDVFLNACNNDDSDDEGQQYHFRDDGVDDNTHTVAELLAQSSNEDTVRKHTERVRSKKAGVWICDEKAPILVDYALAGISPAEGYLFKSLVSQRDKLWLHEDLDKTPLVSHAVPDSSPAVEALDAYSSMQYLDSATVFCTASRSLPCYMKLVGWGNLYLFIQI